MQQETGAAYCAQQELPGPGRQRASSAGAQEDKLLLELINRHGTSNWSIIARDMPGRNGKSCRLRCACARGRPAAHCTAACLSRQRWQVVQPAQPHAEEGALLAKRGRADHPGALPAPPRPPGRG